MPLGPPEDPERFEDFDACVDAISGDGTSEEEARRICGEWEDEKEENSESMNLEEKESLSRMASLADSLDGSPPFVIHGVAIGPGDVTKGQTGKSKLWPAETLQQAASSLKGRPLVRDHINTTEGVVGEVTEARWKPGQGVLYEAELDDRELAEKIANGRLEVSARIKHPATEDLNRDPTTGAFIIDAAVFDNLSVVPTGAAPSNEVDLGEADMMSEAELRAEFDYDCEDSPDNSCFYEELEQYAIEDLAAHDYNIPSWGSTSKRGWESPQLSDFRTEDMEKVSQHFLASTSGFPPENFNDLKLPVVDENGRLNLRALRIAKRAASQVNGVSEQSEEKIKLIANTLIKSNFPAEAMTASLEEVDEDWDRDAVVEYLEEKLDMEGETESEDLEEEETEEESESDEEVAESESDDGDDVSEQGSDDDVAEEDVQPTRYQRFAVQEKGESIADVNDNI